MGRNQNTPPAPLRKTAEPGCGDVPAYRWCPEVPERVAYLAMADPSDHEGTNSRVPLNRWQFSLAELFVLLSGAALWLASIKSLGRWWWIPFWGGLYVLAKILDRRLPEGSPLPVTVILLAAVLALGFCMALHMM